MSTPIATVPLSALHEVHVWSRQYPDWQRDALRRIVVNGGITKVDLSQLLHLCRSKYIPAGDGEEIPKCEPLSLNHLPPRPGATLSTSIESIGSLQRVNRLPNDETITFGVVPGLTVVYGGNGTGKSGYTRVIKKACRTRGALPTIFADVFGPPTNDPATAIITFMHAGEKHQVVWTDGSPADIRLSNVFVFDSSTAIHYLEEDGPATFTPWGLDVLPKLSRICDALRVTIQDQIERLKTEISVASSAWKPESPTAVSTLIAGLSADTKESDIDDLAGVDETQTTRLKELDEALKSDGRAKAKATRAAASRIRELEAKVKAAAALLADGEVVAIRKLVGDLEAAKTTAQAFAGEQFDASHLSGTGNDVWRILWEAARSFSATYAYTGQEFPVVAEDARCVLCQNRIDNESGQSHVASRWPQNCTEVLARRFALRGVGRLLSQEVCDGDRSGGGGGGAF